MPASILEHLNTYKLPVLVEGRDVAEESVVEGQHPLAGHPKRCANPVLDDEFCSGTFRIAFDCYVDATGILLDDGPVAVGPGQMRAERELQGVLAFPDVADRVLDNLDGGTGAAEVLDRVLVSKAVPLVRGAETALRSRSCRHHRQSQQRSHHDHGAAHNAPLLWVDDA